jgi:hypothetical protein
MSTLNLEKPQHITSLATAGILVAVDVNVWSATKQDREISNEVTHSKKADESAGRFVKNLLANNPEHKSLLNYRQTIYNWMQRVTFDWNKSQNYLPAVSLPKFMQEFSEHHTEFNRLLEAFLAKYNDIVTDMAFKQGDMFNRDDYPTVDQVRSKFGVSLFRNEVPLGDFRCQVAQDLADDMQVHYSRQAQQIVDGIMQDQMDRLLDVMQSIAHCCGVDEYLGKDGEMKQKKRKIYEGTIDKAKGLCQSYSQFNLTNDARLTEVVNELNIALRGIDAETLRESDAARSQVKDNVDEILSKFAPRTTV